MFENLSAEDIKQLTDSTTVAGSVSVGITAVQVFSINTHRRLALITNDSITDIYLGLNNSVSINTGIRLNSNGGSFEFGRNTLFPYLGEIWAIAAVPACNLTFIEV